MLNFQLSILNSFDFADIDISLALLLKVLLLQVLLLAFVFLVYFVQHVKELVFRRQKT